MNTPIYDFLQNFEKRDFSRLFMPGHKGNSPFKIFSEICRYDITEIEGADSLFHADGIIQSAEENTAQLFGAENTCFSVGGSTLCIQAMLALAQARAGYKRKKIIAARNAHTAFINSCILLNLEPVWVMPNYNDAAGISGEITPHSIKSAVDSCPEAIAVYVTSPDYLGCISDIEAIAKACGDIPLLVDNAHGAHLGLLENPCHPIKLGAALCCDSAHKTLPVLTGGAYLHSAVNSGFLKSEMKEKMSLFGSTSPSYLIMLSLDLCNKYIEESGKSDVFKLCSSYKKIMAAAEEKGFMPISENCDITKITLDGYCVGMTGEELADYLRGYKIECEYSGDRHTVLMLSPQNSQKDIDSVINAINAIKPRERINGEDFRIDLPPVLMSPRRAAFAPSKVIAVDDAEGLVAAKAVSKCPPGVPIVLPGEKIDSEAKKVLKKCSISFINVLYYQCD